MLQPNALLLDALLRPKPPATHHTMSTKHDLSPLHRPCDAPPPDTPPRPLSATTPHDRLSALYSGHSRLLLLLLRRRPRGR